MPRFVVTKCVDAYVNYVGIVDAKSATAARLTAEEQDSLIDWKEDGVTEFDEVEWDNVSPEPVADDFAFGRSEAEIMTDAAKALRDMRAAYGRLHDFLSDAIEGGRLKESDIPDDYAAIVAQLEGPCSAADDAAKKIIAGIDAL